MRRTLRCEVPDLDLTDTLLARLPTARRGLVLERLTDDGHLAAWSGRDRNPLRLTATMSEDTIARALEDWCAREEALHALRVSQWASLGEWLAKHMHAVWCGQVLLSTPKTGTPWRWSPKVIDPAGLAACGRAIAGHISSLLPGSRVIDRGDLRQAAWNERNAPTPEAQALLEHVRRTLAGMLDDLPDAFEGTIQGGDQGLPMRFRMRPGLRWTTAALVSVTPGDAWGEDHWLVVAPVEPLPE